MVSLAQTLLQRLADEQSAGEKPPRVYGVTFNKRDQLWVAQVYRDGKTQTLGRFKNRDDAVEARETFTRLHPEYGKKRGKLAAKK